LTSGLPEVELDQLATRYAGGGNVGPVSLSVARGELLALLGPSGCGKTTVLRMLAGFVAPTSGAIRLRGRDVTRVRPHRRGVALVFQSFALFPHLSVSGNIAFGLRRHGAGRVEIRHKVGRLIEQMRLDGLADRMPAALSGGQQQRVAIARALAIEPAVVLLDEPFSSLDAKLRESTRQELRGLQQALGFTAILVTHDQSEALSIADRVAVMQAGRLEQVDTPQVVYQRPATRFVAGFVGRANTVPGGIVRPEAIRIAPPGMPGFACRVVSAAFLGGSSELLVEAEDGTRLVLVADGMAPAQHPPGSPIHVTWPPEAVISFGEQP
jgi:ABC-type Fe3+/spermidine/putrescine transport system ATPase subunit